MKLSKKTKKAGALAGILMIVIVLLSVFLPGFLKPTVAVVNFPKEHLFVDETILLKTNETNETVDVTCIIYLTNIWEKLSEELKATAYVIETENNFAISEAEVDIGFIGEDATTKVKIPVTLSNNSYKIKVLLFEDGKLVIKGEIIIHAATLYSWEDIEHGVHEKQEWRLYNSGISYFQVH